MTPRIAMSMSAATGKRVFVGAVQLLVAVAVVLLLPQCKGKKEPPAMGRSAQTDVPGIPVTGGSSGAPAVSAGGEAMTVRVIPSTPSRLDPPKAVVAAATDPPRSPYHVSWRINGKEGSGGDRLAPDQYTKGDRVQAVVTWNAGDGEKQAVSREVIIGNSPPTLGDVKLAPLAPVTGGSVRVEAAANDLDGDKVSLAYKWYLDEKELPETGDVLSLKGVRKGSWVNARVDTRDDSGTGPWKYSTKYMVVNSPPVVRSTLPLSVPADRKFGYRIVAEDPDGDPLTYTLEKGPPGMVLNGSTLEWLVPPEYLGRNAEIAVKISDGYGGVTRLDINMTVRDK
jgi:hypothetical protein